MATGKPSRWPQRQVPDGIIDHEPFEGAMTGERFRIRMNALVKWLRSCDLVICDNLAAHKVSGIREILQTKGADTRFPPPYSTEINSIERAIAHLKSRLGKVGAGLKEDPNTDVKEAVHRVTAARAWNHFKS